MSYFLQDVLKKDVNEKKKDGNEREHRRKGGRIEWVRKLSNLARQTLPMSFYSRGFSFSSPYHSVHKVKEVSWKSMNKWENSGTGKV